jgi:hypothetical protein
MYDVVKEVFKNDTVKNEIKTALKSIGGFIYGELYFYVLIVAIYCVLLFLFVLGILIYLLSISRKLNHYIAIIQNNSNKIVE